MKIEVTRCLFDSLKLLVILIEKDIQFASKNKVISAIIKIKNRTIFPKTSFEGKQTNCSIMKADKAVA